MKKNAFIKPEMDLDQNGVDYFNMYRPWSDCIETVKTLRFVSETHLENTTTGEVCGIIGPDNYMEIVGRSTGGLIEGKRYSKFMLFSKLKFKGKHVQALNYVQSKWLSKDMPYIRVGPDYYKLIQKTDRYGIDRKTIKTWKKEEIKEDHGANIMSFISRFDDFCIEPDNTNHNEVINGCYNAYSEFSFKPHNKTVTPEEIPVSLSLMDHIFKDQLLLGLQYMKCLYELPKQALPVLCLVSRERQTGKTTFMNWLNMMFGDNFASVNPADMNSKFNSLYATKNIIAIDETVIDKTNTIEKIKSLATAKMISVNRKNIAEYMLPFFGKIIICTNKETDFIRIDEDEIRFWVRKIGSISHINTKIESQLLNEIPKFIKFLKQTDQPDMHNSRMVFTTEQLMNEFLINVKKESKSTLYKELKIVISDFLSSDSMQLKDNFMASPLDIKHKWFERNQNYPASYIRSVLKNEFLMKTESNQRYFPLNEVDSKTGTPYLFNRSEWTDNEVIRSENGLNEEGLPF